MRPAPLPDPLRDRLVAPGRTRLGALGVAVAVAGLALSARLSGLAAGLGLAAAWWFLSAPTAYAAGHVLALAALPAPLPALVAVEAGLAGVLAGSVAPAGTAREALAAAALVALALVAGWLASAAVAPLVLAAGLLVGAAALASYGLHRYEQVALGLVDADPTPGGEQP